LHHRSSFCFAARCRSQTRNGRKYANTESVTVDLKKQQVGEISKRWRKTRDLATYEISSAEKMKFRGEANRVFSQ